MAVVQLLATYTLFAFMQMRLDFDRNWKLDRNGNDLVGGNENSLFTKFLYSRQLFCCVPCSLFVLLGKSYDGPCSSNYDTVGVTM